MSHRLNKVVYEALQNADTRAAFEASGNMVVSPTSVPDLNRVYRDEIARCQAVARSIRLESQSIFPEEAP